MPTFKKLVSKFLSEDRVDYYNGELVLYHGTVRAKAQRIKEQGFRAIETDISKSVEAMLVPYIERAISLALERNPQLELLGGLSQYQPDKVAALLKPTVIDYIEGVRHAVSRVDTSTDRGVYASPDEFTALDYARQLGSYGSELHRECGLTAASWVTSKVSQALPNFKGVYTSDLGRYQGGDGDPFVVKFHARTEQLTNPHSGLYGEDVLRKLDRGERAFEIIVVGDVPSSSIISIYEV